MTDIVTDLRVAANGRLVLPKAIRNAMGVHGETKLIATVQDGELKLSPISKGVARAQEIYRLHVKHERSSDEFLATRERD